MNTSAPAPADIRPALSRTDTFTPPRATANDAQRGHFENLLSGKERPHDVDDESDPIDPGAWGLGEPQNALPRATVSHGDEGEGGGSADGDSGDTDGVGALPEAAGLPTPALQPVPDIQVPAPAFFMTPMPQQARLFGHLAMPLAPSEALGHFEVLDSASSSSLVSHIAINTVPSGGLSVAVGTSVHKAMLMDRYLPQLQRRLADKGPMHLRVEESDAERE